ncbi:MAG: L-iditol 2-dehydrogenase [Geminicoccaceae bacterium]|nr:L-iditol 2-dehydrogenase [Geminicoccaceae bacterium]MCB9944546.1 L-iditol 2-dehydrogenase [Geminicoccaceae bacterium]
MKLQDKVAVVTGGARGIGAAICRRYAEEGARVFVADILAEEAEATAREIGGIGVRLDVTSRRSIDDMVERVVDVAGGIDILVNGAAVFDMAPFLEITEESYDRQFLINVKGTLFTSQAVAARMVERGKGGKIVNFASQAGRRGEALVAVYCATKAAIISLTQSMGQGLIKHGINVNGIAPGVIDTPMWDVVDGLFAKYENIPVGEKKRQVGEAVPYGRMGHPGDIVGAAVFLASSDADYIVAQTLNVDGGNCMN